MESDGGSSASRRSGDGGRRERSSSKTQGFFSAKVGHERDRAAPKCHCGVYVVLCLSKTSKNPNRLFFRCPFFKYASKFGSMAEMTGPKEEEVDVDEHFGRLKIENRVTDLEERVASIEKKSNMKIWLVSLCFIVGLMAVYVNMV
ncbi:hypothetical protein PIB30_043524 [Stylosanthes scabra]|uniref:Zinc finger GRF-type domain-containing protein n=1 Tax=Stylosanthes scabra TaxID=79078 RepID=A0ABU6UE82_9FABA|nr:hypothetical protein [Stylosanthes scabra]